ncbi:MAG: FtsX-like permease family protein, partial [Aestuariivirga sp.]
MNLWFKLALRNLRSGLRGFWILLSCLTLGVSAIAIIGSLAASIQHGLVEQGQQLMGGDVEFSLTQREATPDELSFLQKQGEVSHVVTMRAMAQGSGASTLVELKAVDPVYPLFGKLELASGDQTGAVVEPLLLQRLNLKVGDSIKLGQGTFKISGVIDHEPDRIAGGFVLGPRVLISQDELKATGLVQPGSLVNYNYRIKLPGNATLAQDKVVLDLAKAQFPTAGWRGRATDKAAQGADEFVGKLASYLTLVSIAALVVGGAGIANAVSAFVARRQSSLAILKSLGASTTDAIAISLIEILLVSLVGLCVALVLGAVTPYVVKTLFGSIIPLPISLSFNVKPLVLAAVLGLLVTTAFSLWPLARITAIKGAEVFRMQSASASRLPPWRMIAVSLALLAVASLICIFTFDDMRVTSGFIGGLAAAYLGLWAISALLVYVAQLLPRPKNFILRQAITSLYRPGSGSRSVIMA